MDFRIFSDLHRGQVLEILVDPIPVKGDVYLGDIYDEKNTAKKRISEQLAKQQKFIDDCKKVGAYYVRGNHDLRNDLVLHQKIGNVLFTHGHYLVWDQATIQKWEDKKPVGVGRFRQATLVIQDMYERGEWKPSDLATTRAITLANAFQCDTVCFGHTHTSVVVDFKASGVRIVNVPRGMTNLSL